MSFWISGAPTHPNPRRLASLATQTRVFMEGHYLHNFVQSTFDSLPAAELLGSTLVVSGDGRWEMPLHHKTT